ncbi:MAG: transcription termination/antitermination protein NusA [Gemmatimonadetes bacterium]|nr:transcription termination/antitermination protein NusA [Gemmatimonadota bacterium]
MNYEVIEALGQIAREKNVDKSHVIGTLQAGLIAAVRKKHGALAEVDVVVDEANHHLGIYLLKNVVDDVEDPVLEASVEEAREYDPELDVGHVLRIELPIAEFGRNAIQAVKQVVVQRVREAERENVYDDYHNRVSEVVTGTVQQVDRGNLVVNLGRTEALLPYREQIPREMYRQGDTIRAVIIDVQKNTKGPQIILSRTHPSFLEQLFRMEVPEVYEGVVEIKATAREAGIRSKIAVYSTDDRIDPVGACVGMKGSRVQAVVRELSGERIDIVPWSADDQVFVTRALAPAKVVDIEVVAAENTMLVTVGEGQLSLAIGKKGQNARLAAKLTGWKIDLVKEEVEEGAFEGGGSSVPMIGIENLPGVGPKLAQKLMQEGLVYVQDLRTMDLEQLCAIEGVGEKTGEQLLASAEIMLEEAEKAVKGISDEEEIFGPLDPPEEKDESAEAAEDDTSESDEDEAIDAEPAADEEASSDDESGESDDSGLEEAPAAEEPAATDGGNDDADAEEETAESVTAEKSPDA